VSQRADNFCTAVDGSSDISVKEQSAGSQIDLSAIVVCRNHGHSTWKC